LAAKSGYSQASLSAAESGRRAPSWELTAAFVQSCGGDPVAWRQLWELAAQTVPAPAEESEPAAAQAAADTESPQAAADEVEEDDVNDLVTAPGPDGMRRRPASRMRVVLVGAGICVLVAAGVVGGLALADGSHPAQTGGPARDGTDPYDDGCKADEKQLDWQPVYYPDGRTFGTLLLMGSASCQAAWGYLDGPNTTAWTTHIVAHRIPGSASAPSQFYGNASFGSWGNVLSTHTGCVYVEAYVTDSHSQGPHARTACIELPSPTAK
jgi:hypothetical protein